MSILKPFAVDKGNPAQPTRTGFIDQSSIAIPQPAAMKGSLGGVIRGNRAARLPNGLTSKPLRGFADLFYFRIWVLPPVLDVQNPKLNTDIPFVMWNAYLVPNTLNIIGITGDNTGLTIDAVVTTVLGDLELRTFNAQISEAAPIEISVTYDFTFTFGTARLLFQALLADILPIEPNYPILEGFAWNTNVIPHYDGSESRIALRARPRRSFGFEISLLNVDDRKKLLDKLYKVGNLNVIAPAYPYQSPLKVATVIGDNKLYTNTKRADLRVGEKVIVRTRAGVFYLFTVQAVFTTYVQITTAFAVVIPAMSIVTAGAVGRLPNKSGIAMGPLAGTSGLRVDLTEPREQIQFPVIGYALPTFNGLPIVLRNPVVQGDTDESFDSGVEVMDNQTGRPQFYTSWAQSYLEGHRAFLCQSLFDIDEREFWRTFLDYSRGMQKPFYICTYREDLYWDDTTLFLNSQITVTGTEYATQYFEAESYRQVQIESSAGTFQVKVTNATNNGTSVTLGFSEAIIADLTGATVTRISFMPLVRLGSDKVKISHFGTYSIVELDIRAVSDADV